MINFLFKVIGKEYIPLNKVLISKNKLIQNYKYLALLNKNLQIAPVLKSNAYGHSIEKIAKILDSQNVPMLCVDSLFEAYCLKKAKIKTPILIMGYIHPSSLKVKKLPFYFSVFSQEQLQIINNYQKDAQVHIKIDTGMHRIGVPMDDLVQFINKLKKYKTVNYSGLMSHIAYQDDLSETLSKKQFSNFKKAINLFHEHSLNPQWVHIGASQPFLRNPSKIAKYSNMVRIGLALYGIDPSGKHPKLQPILKLISQIVQIKQINTGDTVGYSGNFIASEKMKIGVLPIGYNDGVDRNLSNCGFVKIENAYCKIVGNISMNITTVDLTNVKKPYIGQEVIVFSDNPKDKNSIINSAKLINRLPYELLVNLSEISLKREVI